MTKSQSHPCLKNECSRQREQEVQRACDRECVLRNSSKSKTRVTGGW